MSTLTPAQIAYMEAHASDNRGPGLIACGAITLVASYIAVVLRLIARRTTVSGWGADDYSIVIAVGFFTVFTLFVLLTTRYGMGRHIIFVTSVKDLTIAMTVAEILYNGTIVWIKASILMLYRRLFPLPAFQILIWVMMAVNVSYNIIFMLLSAMQCLPIQSRWDPTIPSKCVDYYAAVIVAGVTNIVTDVILFAMPLPLIHRLHIPGRKKQMLSLVFATGACACVVSLVRCIKASALNSPDSTWIQIDTLYVSSLEICVGIISACVSTYRPLIIWLTSKMGHTTRHTTHPADQFNLSTRKAYLRNGWSGLDSQQQMPDEAPTKAINVIAVSREYTVSVS